MGRGVVRCLTFFLFFVLIASAGGCGQLPGGRVSNKKEPRTGSIQSYKDIPGVTAEEIAAIEALKASREQLTYGVMISTESFPLPDGTLDGFTVRLCAVLSELFDIPFVLEVNEWDELIEKLDAQVIDFTGELTATEERLTRYFMTLPIAERVHRIFTLTGSEEIQHEKDTEGLTIGFLEGTITAEAIRKLYPVSFHDVEVADYPAAAAMLKSGDIDAFIEEAVADPAFDEFDFIRSKIFFPLVNSPVSMTTANPELAPIISVIDRSIAFGWGDRLFEFYEEGDLAYARNKWYKSLTDEEKAYLENLWEHTAVPIVCAQDHYPICFYNKQDREFQGIAVDVLTEISKLTDINFNIVSTDCSTWADIYEQWKSGRLPKVVLQPLPANAQKEDFIWTDVSYSRSHYAIISRSDFPNMASHQIARHPVGVRRQSGHADIYHAIFPNNRNLIEFDTMIDSLDALERGEIDLLMACEHTLMAQTRYREKPDFKVNLQLPVQMESHFGFNKDEEILRSIISKAQQFVPTETIETQWRDRAFNYSRKMAEQRAFLMSVFAGIVSLLLAATIFLLVRIVSLSNRLKEAANTDALTETLNRRYFLELAAVQIERSVRTGNKCFIVIYDLDRFKLVNDKYGHLAGDRVLKETARRIKAAIRPYDLFGRYGGEEFILLLCDLEEKDAVSTAERLRRTLCNAPVMFEGISIPVSASFGMSLAAAPNEMIAATQQADGALYQAKRDGRNRVVLR